MVQSQRVTGATLIGLRRRGPLEDPGVVGSGVGDPCSAYIHEMFSQGRYSWPAPFRAAIPFGTDQTISSPVSGVRHFGSL